MKFNEWVLFFILPLLFALPLQASLVFTPKSLDRSQAKLLVVIHGCLQTPESMSLGTGWNAIAEKNNMVVLYPRVPEGTHKLGCWGWYLPENQIADSGQLKNIFEEIQLTIQTHKLRAPEIFLTGISSGAATVAGLIACYPQMFKAAAVHSGPSYGLAQNLDDAEKILKQGPTPGSPTLGPCDPKKFTGDLLVIQGSSDKVVHPKHAERWIQDFIGTEPKALRALDASSKITDFKTPDGRRGRTVVIRGLGHAWAGFKENLTYKLPTLVPFFSEQGPSATNLSWEFFQEIEKAPAQDKGLAPILKTQ